MAQCVVLPVGEVIVTLQARRNEQTRAEIYQAAATLFLKQGFSKTSVSQIADMADVSRRTIYRHFQSKDEIAYEIPRQWLAHYLDLIDQREPSESDFDVCHRSIVGVARFIQSDRARIETAYQFMTNMPSMRPTEAALNRAWLEAHRSLLTGNIEAGDLAGALRGSVMAGALVGGTDGAFYIWLSDPTNDLVELTEQVWDSVKKIKI